MQLTQFSDYAMRTVLYLGCRPERLISVDEISRAYGVSRHHLVRVAQSLTELGVVSAQRGRGGGMRLAKKPAEINVGWLIRQTEPHFHLVECFNLETNTCPIVAACGLKGALQRAQEAFLEVLDQYTLDQFIMRKSLLLPLLDASLLRNGENKAAFSGPPVQIGATPK
jgi:Rrf2 family nitric oxide-sensitive transcriptional repressor